ncbi:hypothetical protein YASMINEVIRUS_870 [Yasminevirus sp. GU-2018]|uniref:AN1-type domain-containing protein n=1 Tax=Yasminevirus sp. GU-2018 TaxID=2420051 RepID=A0A5K0U913_9VIRU|nr:hypothetical protein YASMINEVIRUS_870 [Yasminevirus sp. GU-2018]
MATNKRDAQEELTQEEILQIIQASNKNKDQRSKPQQNENISSGISDRGVPGNDLNQQNIRNVSGSMSNSMPDSVSPYNINNTFASGSSDQISDADRVSDTDFNQFQSQLQANLQYFLDNYQFNQQNNQTETFVEQITETSVKEQSNQVIQHDHTVQPTQSNLQRQPRQIPKRCEFPDCKMKLNILSIECRCGLFFCNKHKFFTDHTCSYDYKGEYAKILKEKIPKIEREKVDKL